MLNRWLRIAFFALLVRPVILLFLGVNVRRRQLMPLDGPAVIVANHNSHLDTLVLTAMFPLMRLHKVRPVAAEDYFTVSPVMRWFALNIIGVLPIKRGGRREGENPLASCVEALDDGAVLILFPEGTRGEPERRAELKKGVAHLVKDRPETPVTPVFLHGLGKALPKGASMLVPFNCHVFVGEPYFWTGDVDSFMAKTETVMRGLGEEKTFPEWT